MIAGGTGVTPMISYMRECGRYALGGILLWWVRGPEDLFLMGELETWANESTVKIVIYYTQSGVAGMMGDIAIKKGRINRDTILAGVGGSLPVPARAVAVLISGPEGFVDSAISAINEIKIPSERVISLD
jgi:ferredoxin-NADP reductase